MKKPGQVALLPFPRVDLTPGKPRPVLLLARVPGPYFEPSGLKTPSVVRLAVVSDEMLLGCIGAIGEDRPSRIQDKLANWIRSTG